MLADIFENFRETCILSYVLDPAHYYTLPGYTWDAMPKYTKTNLELLTDNDHLLFIDRGIRGGVSQGFVNRYAKANNKYMEKGYDKNSEVHLIIMKIIIWCIMMWFICMVTHWVNTYPREIFSENTTDDVSTINDNSPIGYILEEDL